MLEECLTCSVYEVGYPAIYQMQSQDQGRVSQILFSGDKARYPY